METVQMSAEERAQFEEFKAAKAKKAEKLRLQQEKLAYKELASEKVDQLIEKGRAISENLRAYKREVYEALAEIKGLKDDLYGKVNTKSDTYSNLSNTRRITTGQYELDSFDETADIAASKIEEFMATLAKDSEDSQTLYSLLQGLISRDKNGNLRAANVLNLRRKVEENPRLEPIREMVNMIQDAWQPVKTKTFVKLEERMENGRWKTIPLNATEV